MRRLDKVHSQALQAWPQAVKAAEEELQAARQQVAASLEEVQHLAADLGLTADLNSEVCLKTSCSMGAVHNTMLDGGFKQQLQPAWRRCSAWLPTWA